MIPLTKPPVDFDTVLFRASANGEIMAEPQAKADKDAGKLGETAKKRCRKLYRELMYGRTDDTFTKYMEKGLMVEEDAITLLSLFKGKMHKKNEEKLTNKWVSGHPDLFEGTSILKAESITDIKASWDLFTFPFPVDPINPMYDWQGQTYMDLSETGVFYLTYCLIDTPLVLINDEQKKLMWKMGVATDENPEYMKACEELERNMTFGDIDIAERICEFEIKRDQDKIDRLHKRVEKCREYLWTLYESYRGKRIPEEIELTDNIDSIVLTKI